MGVKCPRCPTFNAATEPFCLGCKLDLHAPETKEKFWGECWFCGDLGQLTKEHVIPQWTFEHAGILNTKFAHLIGRPRDKLNPKAGLVYGRGRLHKRPTAGGQWAPIACNDCNTGWMSSLNSRAKDLILPFIMGQQSIPNDDERTIIARWLSMIVSGSEYYVGNRIIPQYYRDSIKNGTAGYNWVFSYARCGSAQLNGTVQINSQSLDYTPAEHREFLVSAWITIGKTIFHAFAASGPWSIWHAIGPYREFQSRYGLRSLWPNAANDIAGPPHILTWARVRRAQRKIISGEMRPSRDIQPEDIWRMQ
jgi:hypothetical protein